MKASDACMVIAMTCLISSIAVLDKFFVYSYLLLATAIGFGIGSILLNGDN